MKIWGPYSFTGLTLGAAVALCDQLHKAWMVSIFDGMERPKITVTSFFDIILIWNRGISYGLFRQDSDIGRWLLVGLAWLLRWLWPFGSRGSNLRYRRLSVGLIIGGAIGNAIDRLHYGAVADFFSFHAGGFNWYVFNLADVAIVGGVAGKFLYNSLKSSHKSAGKQA